VQGVREEQGAQGQLTSSKGPERMGIREQGIAFPGKNIFLLSKKHPLGFIVFYG
jgi:hypothetical protein